MSLLPKFNEAAFLREHVAHTMDFYHPRAIDPSGGFFHYFKDDGAIYDRNHRHLVSSTRFIFNYAMAAREFQRSEYLDAARHGVAYLRTVHRNAKTGGYAWTVFRGQPEDTTNHAYGLAFVLLAYSHATMAGIVEARSGIAETFQVLEKHFWDAEFDLYRDEAEGKWQAVAAYRGQNANMHLCEALLAAFDATDESRYLQRARQLARSAVHRLAPQAQGLIWEHYKSDWTPDWEYNRDNPRHLFRPWGFQPGHQTEWAKLLLTLHEHGQEPWLVPAAQALFDRALKLAWDESERGIFYGFAPDGSICDDDKYFWVQAETIAAAARLAVATRDSRYWDWYERLWSYAWEHFVDHRHGAWYRILDRHNRKYNDEKSPAGKTDYHTMGACYDVLSLLRRQSPESAQI